MPLIKKTYITINNNFFVGTLLLLKDNKNRYSFKFSPSKKFGQLVLTGEQNTNDDKFDYKNSKTKIETKENFSFEASFKFSDNKLELKRETQESIERTFYNVPVPAKAPLFFISRESDKDLPLFKKKSEAVINLEMPKNFSNFGINFSLPQKDGTPIIEKSVVNGDSPSTISWNLPNEVNIEEIFISYAANIKIPEDSLGFEIWIPYKATKET